MSLTAIAIGNGLTVTFISDRGPSHPVAGMVWLTKYGVVPIALVNGVGAVELGIPPVADVYQFKVEFAEAIAVNGLAVSLRQ